MTPSHEDRLAELFDALAGLDAAARARALDAAGLEPAQRAELEALLEADRSQDTRLDRALSGAALRLRELAAAPLPQGATIGAWRIERELGAGGMGTVFLARRADAGDEQRGALKLLRGFPTEEGRKRLRQERRVLASLEHPYIARLLDGGETEDGQPYLVMAYVDGETVTAFAARRAPDAAARVALIDRIAEAVAHAHQRLVIHRDLKPSNVLVRDDGTPRVLDFGVAKLIDAAGDTGGTSTRVWTPGYASPEQRSGAAVTTASDVYALGILLRELLDGRKPDGTPCVPALTPVAADPDLRGIVAKAAADDPGARYPTVEALRDDLARWRDGRPVRAARDTALYRVRKFVRRHRGSVSLVLLVLVALGAFVWRLGIERDRALEAEALAEQRRLAADQTAETARGALEFIGGVLAEVSGERNIDAPITLRDVLERGGERVSRELPPDSPTRPLIGIYFGDIRAQIGDSAGAEPLFSEGLARLERLGLDRGLPYGLAARSYASVLVDVGRLEDSYAWLRRSSAALRADGADALGVAEAAINDTQLAIYQERFSDAEREAREATAAAIAAGVRAQTVASLQVQHLVALNAQARSGPAIEVAREGIRRLAANGLARSLHAYQFEQEQAKALYAEGRLVDALAGFDRARDVWVQARGETGFLLIILDEWRTATLRQLGRLGDARRVMEAGMARFPAATGRTPDALSQLGLADLLAEEGNLDRAAALARELLRVPDAVRGLTDSQRRGTVAGAGWVIARSGAYAEGRAILEAQIAESSAALGADTPMVAAHHLQLAEAALLAGDLAVAGRALVAAQAKTAPSPRLERLRGRLALAEGRLAEAATELESLAARSDPKTPVPHAIAQLDLAALRAAQGREDEALDLLRRFLPPLREGVLPAEPARARAEALALRLGSVD